MKTSVRITINGGTAQRVKIKTTRKRIRTKDIPTMLRDMPKPLLAKALNIPQEEEKSTDV